MKLLGNIIQARSFNRTGRLIETFHSCFLYRNDWTKTTHMRAIDVWVILCYVGVFSTLVEYCFVLYLTKSSILDSKGGLISQHSSFLSGSCHLARASNVEIGVECQIFVSVIFLNYGDIYNFGHIQGALTHI